MKTWAVYRHTGMAVGTVEAKSEHEALQKFAKENHVADSELEDYWVEEIDA